MKQSQYLPQTVHIYLCKLAIMHSLWDWYTSYVFSLMLFCLCCRWTSIVWNVNLLLLRYAYFSSWNLSFMVSIFQLIQAFGFVVNSVLVYCSSRLMLSICISSTLLLTNNLHGCHFSNCWNVEKTYYTLFVDLQTYSVVLIS